MGALLLMWVHPSVRHSVVPSPPEGHIKSGSNLHKLFELQIPQIISTQYRPESERFACTHWFKIWTLLKALVSTRLLSKREITMSANLDLLSGGLSSCTQAMVFTFSPSFWLCLLVDRPYFWSVLALLSGRSTSWLLCKPSVWWPWVGWICNRLG